VDKIINYGSSSMFYRSAGEGAAVVLLHGFAEDGTIWQNQEADLSQGRLLLVPDLPGSGRSSFNPQLKSIGDLAEPITRMLEAEHIDSCVVIGHSMGGYIALAFGEKYPDKVNGLGLFHSTSLGDNEEKKAARLKGIEFISQNGAEAFLKQSIPSLFAEEFREKHPEIVSELIKRYNNFNSRSLVSYYNAMMDRPDRTHVLKEIKKPVLFVIGEKDSIIPIGNSLQESRLPDLCYIHILEQAAHMGMWECGLESTKLLNEFLNQAKE
jgi:pimeloyl-ACP methyl ester carboxylesterase